jgi:hypothetical protein
VEPAEHQVVYQEIADALFASVPDSWTAIHLSLERAGPEPGGFLHSITSPQGFPPVVPVPELYDATLKLDELLQNDGGTLRAAAFRLNWDDASEAWTFQVEFNY